MTLSQLYYWLIIAFMVADFVIGLWLTALNIKASKWPVPKVLEGLYDDKKYRKQQAYSSENRRVGVIISSIGVVFSVCFFAFGGFAWLDGVVRGLSVSDVVRTLLFFGFFFYFGNRCFFYHYFFYYFHYRGSLSLFGFFRFFRCSAGNRTSARRNRFSLRRRLSGRSAGILPSSRLLWRRRFHRSPVQLPPSGLRLWLRLFSPLPSPEPPFPPPAPAGSSAHSGSAVHAAAHGGTGQRPSGRVRPPPRPAAASGSSDVSFS